MVNLQQFAVLNILALFYVNSVVVKVRYSSLKTKNCLLQRDVEGDLQVVAVALERWMRHFVQFHVNITRVKVESLLRFTLEKNDISSFHTFLQFKLQVSWSHSDFISSTNWAFLLGSKSSSTTLLAFHFNLLNCILNFNLPKHLTSPSTNRTDLFLPAQIPCAFAVLAYLSPSKAINLISTSIKLIQRYPHLRPKITSLLQWIFLELFESSLSMQIIGDPFGNIDQNFIGPFNLDVLLLNLIVTCVTVRVELDRQPAEGLLQLVTICLLVHLQQLIEIGLSLAEHHRAEEKRKQENEFAHATYTKYITRHKQWFSSLPPLLNKFIHITRIRQRLWMAPALLIP